MKNFLLGYDYWVRINDGRLYIKRHKRGILEKLLNINIKTKEN